MRKILIIYFTLLIILPIRLFAGAGEFKPAVEEPGKELPPVNIGDTEEVIEVEEETYYITAGDIVIIKLPDEEVFSEYEVNFDGQITIPELGTFMAEGLTIEELEKTIFFAMPVYMRKIGEVEAQIKLKQKYIQVLGHVRQPGWVLVHENVGPQGVIEKAGGSIDGTVLNEIKLYRKIYGLNTTTQKTIDVNLYKFKVVGDLNILPRLKSKDRIVVPMTSRFGNVQRTLAAWTPEKEELETSTEGKIRVMGEVRSPKFLEPIKDSNVLDVIISAGGYTNSADLTNVSVLKKLKSGGYRGKSLNLESYIESQRFEEIPRVTEGELVYVPRRRPTFLQKAWEGSINVITDVALVLTSVATIYALSR